MIIINHVFQRELDGKIEVNYDIDVDLNSGDILTISMQYWDGTSWNNCESVEGDIGIIEEGQNKIIIWDVKTDRNNWYYEDCKIKLIANWDDQNEELESNTFIVDTKNPIINVEYPANNSVVYNRKFTFKTNIIENSDYDIKFLISYLGGNDFDPLIDSGWLHNTSEYSYYLDHRLLMYGKWYWKVICRDKYQNITESDIFVFELYNKPTDIQIISLEKLLDGSGLAKIKIKVKNENYDKISIKFDVTETEGETWFPINIYKTYPILPIEDNRIFIETTEDWKEYDIYIKYSDNQQIELITDALSKNKLEIKTEIKVISENNTYDISHITNSYTINKDRTFGASTLEANVVDKNNEYVPFKYSNPILWIGNKIKAIYYILTKEGVKAYNKFIGSIRNIRIVKSGNKVNFNISASDDFYKLLTHRLSDVEYKPEIEKVDEYLRTYDGILYQSSHESWSEHPAPEIYLNNERVSQDKYIVDFVRGCILFKGNVLTELLLKTIECSTTDRQVWHTGLSFDNSILPRVYYSYKKYEKWMCNDYSGWIYQWVSHLEELKEHVDYYIDYTNGDIYLYQPLPPDNLEPVEGNIKDQLIVVKFRTSPNVRAIYYYQVPKSNEVEDIIKDIVLKSGFSQDILKDSINEKLTIKDNKYLYTSYNNILSKDTFKLYRNGILLNIDDDYELNKKDGIITLKRDDTVRDIVLEDCDYIWDVSSEAQMELDYNDKIEGDASLKVNFMQPNAYIIRNLSKDLYHFSILDQRYISFYAKSNTNGQIKVSISYDAINWLDFNINITTKWNIYTLDLLNAEPAYKDIKYIKITNLQSPKLVWLDLFYIKHNVYTADYIYYTLQKTDITLSKINFNYENCENAYSAIQEILKNVAPNYLLYVDDNGKLRGHYSSQRLLRNTLEIWNNFRLDKILYTRNYYGEHYLLTHEKQLEVNVSEEEVYTGALIIGKSTEPENVALKGFMKDECTWVRGRSYSRSGIDTTRKRYLNENLYVSSQGLIFLQLINQESPPEQGGAEAMIDFDTKTGMFWYARDNKPSPNLLLCELTLSKPVLWDRIDVLIGEYQAKIIKEAIYIEVGDEYGNYWYPDKNLLRIQPGATGGWVTFENNFNQEVKIKKIRVYGAEPWSWSETTVSGGGKGGGGDVSSETHYHYVYSIAEVAVWEKPVLISEVRLDNVLLVGDGKTRKVQIPNTPYKTKNYNLYIWGWVELYPSRVKLYKNSLLNELVEGQDYIYDPYTGIVEFVEPPAEGDVISGTWTLDDENPKETTFYASFANIDLIRKLGIKLYKDVDEGLNTHLKTIKRAKQLLSELTKYIYPSTIDIVFRPDIRIGQSILVVNKDFSLKKIFYIEKVSMSFNGITPTMQLGLMSFPDYRDYDIQEIVPDIYRDFRVIYPRYIYARSTVPGIDYRSESMSKFLCTGLIIVEAIDEQGNIKKDYDKACKLELLKLQDSNNFTLVHPYHEPIITSDMWEEGIAELSFCIMWNISGQYLLAPPEFINGDKFYTDKEAVFNLYEIDNPLKNFLFKTNIRLILEGNKTRTVLQHIRSTTLCYTITYQNYYYPRYPTSYPGNIILFDIYGNQQKLQLTGNNIKQIFTVGSKIYAVMEFGIYDYIYYYDWDSENWIEWGNSKRNPPSLHIYGYYAGKLLCYDGGHVAYDGNRYITLHGNVDWHTSYVIIFNNLLYILAYGNLYVYNNNIEQIASRNYTLPGTPTHIYMFEYQNILYVLFTLYFTPDEVKTYLYKINNDLSITLIKELLDLRNSYINTIFIKNEILYMNVHKTSLNGSYIYILNLKDFKLYRITNLLKKIFLGYTYKPTQGSFWYFNQFPVINRETICFGNWLYESLVNIEPIFKTKKQILVE